MNERRNAHITGWHALLCNFIIEMIESEKYNRSLTVTNATSMVLKFAFGISVWSPTISKLEQLAQRRQREHLHYAGEIVTHTIILRNLHLFILDQISMLGRDWAAKVELSDLRAWAVLGIRAMTAGRTEDPECLLAGIEEFSGTNWFDSKSVGLRFLDTKETNSKHMDSETVRKQADRKKGRLSALVVVHRYKAHKKLPLPDYFRIVGEYVKRRGSPPTAPTVAVDLVRDGVRVQDALHSFFLGVKKFYDRPVTRSTLSGESLRLLKMSQAIPVGSPLKAKHIRHSVLSQVEAHDPSRLTDAIARARNSRQTYETQYRTTVAPEQRQAMFPLPKSAQLELLMLG